MRASHKENSLIVSAFPVIDPAIDSARVLQVLALEGIEAPPQPPGGGVERADFQQSCGQIHHPINHQGCALDAGLRAVRLIARVIGPGWPQLLHIRPIDLVQGGMARGARVAAIVSPIPQVAWRAIRARKRKVRGHRREDKRGGAPLHKGAAVELGCHLENSTLPSEVGTCV